VIFKPELVDLIKQGKKTMTRRPVKPGERQCRYRDRGVYALQPGRGQHADGKITIIAVPRIEHLGEISIKDARREGFTNVMEFLAYWRGLYGSVDRDQEVWVISFTYGDLRDTPRYLAAAPPSQFCNATLPSGRRCRRAFADNQSVCRCGALRPEESEDDHGYTTRRAKALPGELEVIDPELQERFTKEARDRPRQSRREVLLEQRERILDAIKACREHDLTKGVESDFKLIELRLANIDRQLDQEAA